MNGLIILKKDGIGLCCEEACRIILSQSEPFTIIESEIPYEKSDNYNDRLFAYLYNCRNKIINYIENNSIPFNLRIKNVLWYSYIIQRNIDISSFDDIDISKAKDFQKSKNMDYIINFFLKLEPFDSNWIPYLKNSYSLYNEHKNKFAEFENKNTFIFKYLQNISIYFIWRYFLKGVFDNDIICKVSLMYISLIIIKLLFFCKWIEKGDLSLDDCINIVKNYSKEIEYSEQNLDSFENACYNSYEFSIKNLLGLYL